MASGNAGLPAGNERMLVGRKVHEKLDLVKARKYLPPQCFLHHCPWEQRIRGEYRIKDRPNKSCSLAVGQDTAIRVVLEALWKEYVRRNPGKVVPYEFPFTVEDQ